MGDRCIAHLPCLRLAQRQLKILVQVAAIGRRGQPGQPTEQRAKTVERRKGAASQQSKNGDQDDKSKKQGIETPD